VSAFQRTASPAEAGHYLDEKHQEAIMKRLLASAAVLSVSAVLGLTGTAAPDAPPGLTIEQLIDVRHPSNASWSADGRQVTFTWDRAGVSARYVSDLDGRPPRELPGSPPGGGRGRGRGGNGPVVAEIDAVFAPDGKHTAYARPANAAIPESASGSALRNNTELWIRSVADGRESRLATASARISGVTWSPDSAHVLYTVGEGPIRHEQTPAYSGTKIVYTITENTAGQTYAVPAMGGSPVALAAGGFGARRWLDARHFLFERTSNDFKRRTTYVADVAGGEPRVLYEDVEPKFWSMTGDANANAQPSPDGKWIAFLSDRDGWDHLYVMPAAGGQAVQITKGKFEAWRPQWSPDGTRIAFDANEPDKYGTRHIYIATLGADPRRATIARITNDRGTNIAPQWSPDGTRLLYQHTDPHHSADLYVLDVPAATVINQVFPVPRRITDSMPSSIDRTRFVEPEMVRYAGPDGQQVPAWLFVPKSLDRSKKHPAIVWIHGDGVNQNYDGWHVQRNYAVYYSFHQYLLQKGYVVIAPDYRGSIGYGRDWRTGVYMDVGGNDAKDAWMAANYLKTLPYVDVDRVGVWGLSYGGFFTLIAVTDQPKLFRAAVDVAGVVDYEMYYEDPFHGGWTASRIGTPQEHPEVYAKASPLSHVDKLERPLLVLHGTSDVNVPYLHSVRLVDELLKKGKGGLVSFMTYPGEFHYFTREHVLLDAWHRVEQFFDTNLKP
jgi:dipeptidyl aminopeptidase/acylaminoacyl peptidase